MNQNVTTKTSSINDKTFKIYYESKCNKKKTKIKLNFLIDWLIDMKTYIDMNRLR